MNGGGCGHRAAARVTMVGVLLAEVAEVSSAVAGSSGRLAKIAAIAAALRSAGPDDAPACERRNETC